MRCDEDNVQHEGDVLGFSIRLCIYEYLYIYISIYICICKYIFMYMLI